MDRVSKSAKRIQAQAGTPTQYLHTNKPLTFCAKSFCLSLDSSLTHPCACLDYSFCASHTFCARSFCLSLDSSLKAESHKCEISTRVKPASQPAPVCS